MVWLSEIMLQQTQVTTVIPYFHRFLKRFPDVATLAATPVDEVLALWAGLGYYARARNLHKCAVQVVEWHGGEFPRSSALLVELSGIGRSTAAAIAAFAWGERAAILDGNVKRVLCRYFAVEGQPVGVVEKSLWELAESLLPVASEMGTYTQGLMDLGATVCLRRNPRCGECPLQGGCVALKEGRQASLPTPKPGKAKVCREAVFLVITDGEYVLLERRPPTGIWGGLLSLPEGIALLPQLGLAGAELESLPPRKHVFTHFELEIQPLVCRVERMPVFAGEQALEWLPIDAAVNLGVPVPVSRLLGEIQT